MLVIVDDFLNQEQKLEVQSWCRFTTPLNWKNFTLQNAEQLSHTPVGQILSFVSKFFDLSEMIGFEYWINHNTDKVWHYDTDLSDDEGRYPICSIVYYPQVGTVSGGNFLTETESIKPKENRLLFFSPGIYHCVESFEGQRVSLAINPWKYKVKSLYEQNKTLR
jgi:hypothetical protein